MKKIASLKYARTILSQRFYNPDEPGGVGELSDYQQPKSPLPPAPTNLPVLHHDDLEDALEDSYDDRLPMGEDPEGEERLDLPEIPITEDEYPDFPTAQEALNWAEQNNETIRIYYITKGGRDIKRDVEPHGQFMARTTGNRILVTFDRTVGDIRAFIVSNIMHYIFAGEDFEPKFIVSP
tara:strand:+ start:5255 stop:5794 length:540 start_codon:yes stop_codon:yes gene_type:complete